MTPNNLRSVLDEHAAWLRGPEGTRADLCRADLRGADLSGADLSGADLSGANLSGADLRRADLSDADLRRADLSGADLRRADLSGADLRRADLSDADLRRADLRGADLCRANLRGANLRDANLSGADLRGADLRDADLRRANLSGADLSGAKLGAFSIVPAAGAFVLFKKAYTAGKKPVLVRLAVPEHAQRVSSLVGRKCRVSSAVVVSMTRIHDVGEVAEAFSIYDESFAYRVHEIVEPDEAFDPDIRVECTSGIHGFITADEAREY